ncbi:MAG: CapA family protein [Firmicutes bacterium]|nr:CapA family protein [Bacillota bacterium]
MNKIFYTAIFIVIIIALSALYLLNLFGLEAAKKPNSVKTALKLHSEQKLGASRSKAKKRRVAVTRLSSELDNINGKELSRMVASGGQTTISPTNTIIDTVTVIDLDQLTPEYKALTIDGLSVWDDTDYPLVVEANNPNEEEFDKSKVIKMTAVGDVILGRTVYRKMAEKGFTSPFSNVAARLSQADITMADLECPLSDSFTPPIHGMNFLSPRKGVEGLVASGIDIVGLANNHSTNFGSKAFLDTLDVLNENKIAYVGGGANETEAKSSKVLTVKGKKFAFLNFNSIVGDMAAKGNSAGDWHVNLPPWSKTDQKQIDETLNAIKTARTNNDFVIVMVHWGQEYTRDPSQEMKSLAHQLVDAGADLVIGTHPHWIQGVEIYKDKFIAYSLGNFVFDQEWSIETKQGMILDAVFYGNRLVNVSLTPVLIEDFHRPRILGKDEAKPIMDTLWQSSRRINAP